MEYTKENISKNLLLRCQKCFCGGQNKFPECLDFDPTKDCIYFDDINDDDPRDEDYDCGAYMCVDDYNELRNMINK